jgi:hypothetical protein
MRIGCTLFMYNQYKFCSQGGNISSSHNGCSPLSVCAMYCGLMRQYLQDVVYAVYTTCIYGQWKILVLLTLLIPAKDLVSTFGLES